MDGIELVELGWEPIDVKCARLKRENPGWVILDEAYLRTLDVNNFPEKTTFIVPRYMIGRRTHQTKTNRLITYMVVQARKRSWKFKFVANSWDELDIRIRHFAGIE